MQDLQSITNAGGGASRIFGGDRRLRPYPNQPLKCPRCDSLNTKFCYYNNYNLSQPRHFCKSCRRYWTKGGVLRNVPVGGGCRKAKRSNKPKPSSDPQIKGRIIKTSDTSATGITNPPPLALLQPSHNLDRPVADGLLLETNMVSGAPNPAMVAYDYSSEMSPFRMYDHEREQLEQHKQEIEEQIQQLQQQEKTTTMMMMMMEEELTAGAVVDQTELFQKRPSVGNGELTASEWQLGCGDHGGGLLDLPSSAVDHAYWSQSQWIDHDHHLFLPP